MYGMVLSECLNNGWKQSYFCRFDKTASYRWVHMLHLFRKKNLETTDVFRTQSKVYDATFMRNSSKPLFIFAKKTPSQMLDCVLNTPLETITKIINLLVLYQIYQVPLRNKNLNYVKTFPLVCSVFIIYKTFITSWTNLYNEATFWYM